MKIVLTGTTSAGKTTTIDLLKKRGFSVVPEGSIQIILEQRALPEPIMPNTHPEKFQELILERQLELEKDLADDALHFLDRSFIDSHAYSAYYGVQHPKEIEVLAPGRYDKVFILEPLPFYQDKFGLENREMQLAVDTLLREAYARFGYDVIVIPVMEPEERVEYILKQIS